MLSIILIILVAVIALFVIVVSMQPANFCIRRMIIISAPPSAVFPFIDDVHKFQEWSPWAKMDPESKVTFAGPPSGVGASFSWTSSKTGEGSMTSTESRPAEYVKYRLEFLKPFQATNTAEFTLKSEGIHTSVEWSMAGTNGFVFKAFSLIMNSDKMVGGQFEDGLASLKKLAEAGA